jgi:hypothetical protein
LIVAIFLLNPASWHIIEVYECPEAFELAKAERF